MKARQARRRTQEGDPTGMEEEDRRKGRLLGTRERCGGRKRESGRRKVSQAGGRPWEEGG